MDAGLVQKLENLSLQGHKHKLEDGGISTMEDMLSLSPDEIKDFCQETNFPESAFYQICGFPVEQDHSAHHSSNPSHYHHPSDSYTNFHPDEKFDSYNDFPDLPMPYIPSNNDDDLPEFPPDLNPTPPPHLHQGSDGHWAPNPNPDYYSYPQHPYPHHVYAPDPAYNLPAHPPVPLHAGGHPPAPIVTGRPLCRRCKVKEVWVDNNGKESPCCGKRCLKVFQADPSSYPSLSKGMCAICKVKPVYVGKNGVPSKTCSRGHQKQYQQQQQLWAVKKNEKPAGHSGNRCLVENCDQFVFRDAKNGKEHQFCSKSCRDKMAKLADDQGGAVLVEMKPTHRKYKNVLQQIKVTFGKKTSVATFEDIDKIYIVYNPNRWKKYSAYQKKLEAKHSAKDSWKAKVNQQRRFHGTHCECNVPAGKCCGSKTCGICGIVSKGFDMSRYKGKSGWGRYGAGVYLTEVASKAHDYTGKTMKHTSGAGNRWMLLCLTALGEVQKMKKGDTTLQESTLPANIDSVEGLTTKDGGELNYSECVVYNADAVYPCYIINYKYQAGK